jgi:peptidoglycan/xylan/chitin deacetylase (PgdA/CDA1 family)
MQLGRHRVLTERTPGSFPIPAPVRHAAARVGLTCALLLMLLPAVAGVAQAAGQTVVSLTFNDALVSQYNYARPVLQAHNMNATFYVASGWINQGSSAYYAWWQADNLYRDGNEIGGMGYDHKDLTKVYNTDWTQDYAYKKQQVCSDFNWLAARGYDPRSFAYPAGAYNYTFPDGSTARGIVRDCGFLAGRAVGGFSPSGPVYSETLPPKDAYAVRTLSNTSTSAVQLSTLQNAVTAAASRGGGWVPLVFNQVCHQGDANYSSCMSSSKPIDDAVFSQFLDWLANAGQADGAPADTVVKTVRQAMGAPAQPPLPQRTTTVSLTFDDADSSQYRVRSMLTSHGMHATIYVTSREKTMAWSQVDDLHSDGNEIGGHTVNHVDLVNSGLTYDQKLAEVCDDRQTLIQRGYDPVSFAYPFGAYDQTAIGIVRSCGYQSARRAGGVNTAGPTYAETIPPTDPYVVRTVYRAATTELELADLTNPVTAAASHGGGWVVLVFHKVCSQSASDYASCMASYKPIKDTTFNSFLDWLQNSAPPATNVKTVRQVMSGG